MLTTMKCFMPICNERRHDWLRTACGDLVSSLLRVPEIFQTFIFIFITHLRFQRDFMSLKWGYKTTFYSLGRKK